MAVMLELPAPNPRLEKAVAECLRHLQGAGFPTVVVVRRGDPDLGVVTTITIREMVGL